MLERVQEDRNNPLPCSDEDRKKWGSGEKVRNNATVQPTASASAETETAPGPAGSAEEGEEAPSENDHELLKELMGGSGQKGAPSASADEKKK